MTKDPMPNAFRPSAAKLSAQDDALVARRAAALGPAYRLFYERPLHPLRGEGVWLHDADGRAYLDTYNNVASVGHCHPRVVAAMAGQAAVLASLPAICMIPCWILPNVCWPPCRPTSAM